MTSGFGVDPAADGSTGTTSADIRKIFGGLYTPGIISGCVVNTSPTTMTYSITPGVVAIETSVGEVVLAPVAATTVPTATAPTSGDRTEIVYAQQRFASIEGDASVVVGVGPVLPPRAVALKKVIISAGQTNTNAAVPTGNIDFSIAYGATLGRLHYFNHQGGLNEVFQPYLQRFGYGQFSLPTDRLVRWSMSAVMSAQGASGFDNSKYCEYGFLPSYNNGDFVIWTTPGLHQAWQTVSFQKDIVMAPGTYNVNLGALRMVGPGIGILHQGLDTQDFGRMGLEFTIDDIGPIQ